MNTESELEGHLQLQAGSPAQDNRATEGEQLGLAPGKQLMQVSQGEQDGGEQTKTLWGEQRPTIAGKVKSWIYELQVELPLENTPTEGEQTENQNGERRSKVIVRGEQTEGEQLGGEQAENPGGEQTRCEQTESHGGEQTVELPVEPPVENEQDQGEQTKDHATTSQSDKQLPNEQYSQWLKSVMPDASNGWWDVRVKGDRFTVKFRWRGPDLQVIPLLHISREHIETMKQNDHKDVQRRIQDQIAANLQSFLLDSTKCDKAVIAAEKLGIEIENYQIRQIEN